MTHNKVFEWFNLYFPIYAGDKIDTWFPNGKNSLRVRQTNGQEFIFTFNGHKDWKFETIDSFIKHATKGGKS
ncbi:MAG: methionyl-tRNA synthetase [Gammaproteobacteria bacterium]|jgi:hypothetical protein